MRRRIKGEGMYVRGQGDRKKNFLRDNFNYPINWPRVYMTKRHNIKVKVSLVQN
jgi:hypothetical protein